MHDYKHSERYHGITWDELAEREPRLNGFLASVRASKPVGKAEKRCFDYLSTLNGHRAYLEKLVGWHRTPPDEVLNSAAAWNVAFARLNQEMDED